MVCVGIDVAKDKHDCCILDSDGMVRADCFTIPNNMDGFKQLLQTIRNCTKKSDKIKVGLEATGHYSYNILGFLLDNGLPTYVINPLHTNLYRKSLSLRKTKTDRVDARTIATMLLSDVDLKSYTDIAYHNEELKSLTRYRFDKVQECAKLKQSVSRLATILFPELEGLVSSIHGTSIYALLSEYPGAKQISEVHLTKLTNLLTTASKGRYGKEKAIQIREAARASIGSVMPAKSLELKHKQRRTLHGNQGVALIETGQNGRGILLHDNGQFHVRADGGKVDILACHFAQTGCRLFQHGQDVHVHRDLWSVSCGVKRNRIVHRRYLV